MYGCRVIETRPVCYCVYTIQLTVNPTQWRPQDSLSVNLNL